MPARAHQADEPRIISPGGRAAKEVYATVEIRLMTIELLDQATLVSLMGLHRAGMAVIAGMIYKDVHVDIMRKFHRDKNVSFAPSRNDHSTAGWFYSRR